MSPLGSRWKGMNSRAILALAVSRDLHIRYIVNEFRPPGSGIIQMIIPELYPACVIDTGFDLNHAGRMEMTIEKLFITGPDKHQRFAGQFCQLCRLHGLLI